MTKIAVFASGFGSNLEAILEAIDQKKLDAEVKLIICDRPGAYCLHRAASRAIPTLVFVPRLFACKKDYEELIGRRLEMLGVEYLVLAGFMRLIGPTLLRQFPNRIINIHPSLLPQFPGLDGIGQALEAGAAVTGVTVHYVDAGVDTGRIIAQEQIAVEPGESRDSLEKRIHALEHRLYPRVLQEVFQAKEGQYVQKSIN